MNAKFRGPFCLPPEAVMTTSGSTAVPTGVTFHPETLFRSRNRGDNWRTTWAADDSLIVSMCDGNWLAGPDGFHHHLYRVLGGPDGFEVKDLPNYPAFIGDGPESWFGYGLISVDGVLYVFVSKTPGEAGWDGPFRGMKLLASRDNGETWHRINRRGEWRALEGPRDPARVEVNEEEMFFFEEGGLPHKTEVAYPFSYVSFVQCGRDNAAAQDDYLYLYSPEGAHTNRLLLARVEKDRIGRRDEWEFFARYDGDKPVWTRELTQRGPVLVLPEKNDRGNYFGWYSWLPSVVWNEPLGLYIMVNGGTCGGQGMTDGDDDYYDNWMHTETGSLGFWWARHPWGPWHQFYYNDRWIVDDPANRTYQPELSPKWISPDGKEMVLIWSDAGCDEHGRSHSVYYKWNHMRITLDLL